MILIGLGANLPALDGASPEETIWRAIDALNAIDGVSVVSISKLYVSAPVPVSDQPWYRNAVVALETALEPRALLGILQGIEADFGRVRMALNAPRTLDLDLLAYDDVVLEDEDLTLPHPRMHERAFVLLPLNDLAPEWVHPVSGEVLVALIEALPPDQEISPIAQAQEASDAA